MKKLIKKLLKFVIIAAVLVAVALFGIAIYLSPQSKLEHADAIAVISGGETDERISEGVNLYKENYSREIIFSGAAAEGSVSNAAAMRNIAIKEGVRPSDILIDETSVDTEENAANVAKIVKANSINSIILVTSPYHQRRAYDAFRKELGKDFKIINHSAMDKEWRKADWWSNSQARFLTLGEIMKNFYLLFNK